MGHKGDLLLLLHAHLPYVRHPEHERFIEENWLYEALSETYIPLVGLLEDLIEEGVDFRVTLSLSPTLLAMLDDGLLRDRFSAYLERLTGLTEKEVERTKKSPALAPLAKMYNENIKAIRRAYTERYGRDLVAAIKRLGETGKVELITTSATHAYLPNLSPSAVRAQIDTAFADFERRFGNRPRGMWLPECGYYVGLDSLLKEEGIGFTFLESHGLLYGKPRPRYGVFRPARCPSGTVMFARDQASSRQVWSSKEGYPGDPDYRDFYRDIGFDLLIKRLLPFIHPDGIRTHTGIKYHRITGGGKRKRTYVREKALLKAKLHAEDFIAQKQAEAGGFYEATGLRPVLTAPFDAELFGHWWHEGIDWLGFLIRGLSRQEDIRMVTPSGYLSEASSREFETISPAPSSWGRGGYGATWCGPGNNWAIRHIRVATDRMERLAEKSRDGADPLTERALKQLMRELLLMESSDWLFMMEEATAPHYGEERLTGHIKNFNALYKMVVDGRIDGAYLSGLEERSPIFPKVDWKGYGRSFSKG